MSSGSTEAYTVSQPIGVPVRSQIVTRLADYLELTKPRIAVMALVTVSVGYLLGSAGVWRGTPFAHAMFGIALVAAGSSIFNQLMERTTDSRMERTADRPLPSGRITPYEAMALGLLCSAAGTVWLLINVNLLTAILGLATLLLYVGVYTPLKQRSSLCTAIGAVPGALPPVLGWTAAGGTLDWSAFSLFALLFLWQFPHFLAIAWIYRDDYSRAGLKMLPESEGGVRLVGGFAVAYALALLPVSLLPSELALAGTGYAMAAVVLGAGYLVCAVLFARNETTKTARRLLLSSLIYLPTLLLILCWDHVQLLN